MKKIMKRIYMKRFLSLAAVGFLAIAGCGGEYEYTRTSQSKKNPKKLSAPDLQQYVSTNAAIASVDKGYSLVNSRKESDDSTDGDTPEESKESRESKETKVTLKSKDSSLNVSIKSDAPSKPDSTTNMKSSPSQTPSKVVVVDTFVSSTKNANRTNSPNSSRAGSLKIGSIQSSAPCLTETEARYDALKVAMEKIDSALQQMDPPIKCSLSTNRIWNEYVVKSTGKTEPLTEDEKQAFKSEEDKSRIRYTFDVEISSEQIRSLRSEERLKKISKYLFPSLIAIGALGYLIRSKNRPDFKQ
jgi:hypothetical protein